MKFIDFIKYNQRCPICNNSLSLFMQWFDLRLFQASHISDSQIIFKEFIKDHKVILDPIDGDPTIEASLSNVSHFKFSSKELEKFALKQEDLFFYFICNIDGISDIYGDYELLMEKSCYYRASPFFKFHPSKPIKLKYLTDDEHPINSTEAFFIPHKTEELNKYYIVTYNYQQATSTFWFYSATPKQELTPSFKAAVFEKEFPILETSLDFSAQNRKELIKKMDVWVNFS